VHGLQVLISHPSPARLTSLHELWAIIMNRPEIIIIAALAESNRVIGVNGKLPWKIPEDAQRFRELTIGHAVIMGRKTWELDLNIQPLVDRYNVVISNSIAPDEIVSLQLKHPLNLAFVNSLADALKKVQDHKKVYIVGGASIYSQSLNLADTLELTLVEGDFQGDTFFPEYQFLIGDQFAMVNLEAHAGYRFETYQRIAQ
jgi:dihydrofolate reductase